MTSIDPASTSSLSAQQSSLSGSGAGANNPLNQLDNTQTFLQLLVAQLENQNPLDPASPTTFITELSQLTAVEAQTTLTNEEQVTAADSMLGKTVTGTDAAGQSVSGEVQSVQLGSSGSPNLVLVGGTTIALTNVTQVSNGSGTSSGTGSAAAPSSSSSSASSSGGGSAG